jgi:hypothetical protein
MANKKKILSYEDKKYEQGSSLVASLQQAFVDLKYDKEKIKSWNMPIADLSGCTLKIVNDSELCLTYHRVEVGSMDEIARLQFAGKKYLKEVEKELKSKFKKLTGKTLELKKKSEDQNFEKYQHVRLDSSDRRSIGKYFVKDTILYTYSSDVEL